MEAKLDLHSQKLTALVANIPRTDEGFEDLSQRITVLKIIKSILPKQEKKSEVFSTDKERKKVILRISKQSLVKKKKIAPG